MKKSETPPVSPKQPPAASSVSLTLTAVEGPKPLKITINSVMQGVKQAVVLVNPMCTVRDLKGAVEQATEVSMVKQLLLFNNVELKNDDSKIIDCGIVSDCTVIMNVKMSTGIVANPTQNVIFFVPFALPENPDTLRKTIKGMNSVRRPKKAPLSADKNSNIWTPEKHLEAELTRNRMKSLLKRKKKTILSDTPIDSGQSSVQTYSPVATPPEYNTPDGTSQLSSPTGGGSVEDAVVTEKEIKLFFDPPETMSELNRARRELFLPPQDEYELKTIKEKREEEKKTRCSYCTKKLPLMQQTMKCKCDRLFCDRHRRPEVHMCRIDYKQEGRRKLRREHTKVGGGGERKAQFGIQK
ncbi:unnamed protein product [Caenorhabditis auriculariae]|uniref:AN1-type domain-containing protein n=1 Tax=Caenorhabditis auriculariae TaxID=2777116 RepID=A0A8S1HCT2_9PELO|nr:unnamed protein product [Caenorhabditis auriculariae]